MVSNCDAFCVGLCAHSMCHVRLNLVFVCGYVCRIGRHSSRLVRAAALKLADELLEMMSRPFAAGVKRVLEG